MELPKIKISQSSLGMKRLKTKINTRSISVDWQKIFGSEVNKEDLHHGFDVFEKPESKFISGSKYKGTWNLIGMAKFGTFTFPHKVEFEGEVGDGMFNGDGVYTYPMGHKVEVMMKDDKLQYIKIMFPDGCFYGDQWDYCTMPDRRFFIEQAEGLKNACDEYLTNTEEPRKIPDGCYDTGDGFFNPITKCVVSVDDPNKVIRIPTVSEEKWIIANCRKAWDEPVGARHDLYEKWCSGRLEEKGSSTDSIAAASDIFSLAPSGSVLTSNSGVRSSAFLASSTLITSSTVLATSTPVASETSI